MGGAVRGGLHPAVRILLLLLVALALPLLDLAVLLVLGVLAVAAFLLLARSALARLRAGLWRLRWLLLAIFVLYGGFTPGEPLLPALPGLSREGLLEGLRRALVLTDLLVLVYLLLSLTSVPQLVVGLRLLLTPLQLIGIDTQRIGLRIALAFDGVASLQSRLQQPPSPAAGGLWARAAALIEEIEMQAGRESLAVVLPPVPQPRWWEWLLPPAVLVLVLQWLS
jgi:energy-coupling factor transporter transmembrane protein EcfT